MPDTDTTARDRVAALLDRHPNLTPPELDDVLDFFATGPIVDRGMLRGDPAYAATIERIHVEHKTRFTATVPQMIAVVLLMTVPIAIMIWAAARWG